MDLEGEDANQQEDDDNDMTIVTADNKRKRKVPDDESPVKKRSKVMHVKQFFPSSKETKVNLKKDDLIQIRQLLGIFLLFSH